MSYMLQALQDFTVSSVIFHQKPTFELNLVNKDFPYLILRLWLPDLIRVEFTHRTHDLQKHIGGVSQWTSNSEVRGEKRTGCKNVRPQNNESAVHQEKTVSTEICYRSEKKI